MLHPNQKIEIIAKRQIITGLGKPNHDCFGPYISDNASSWINPPEAE